MVRSVSSRIYLPNCYRPLQHLYKTTPQNNTICIRYPPERYQTTNMTYGSFHYNNWTFIQKIRSVKYTKEVAARYNQQGKSNIKRNCSDKPDHIQCC
ncbi:unnamed protein product [Adineta ricciae]|uniref:Uncharacterized protein n=1 Tax=Adineta ricciae TaxID=249248 RepID=A0A814DSN2_ADIRI|nr:unnamed protein product [Adineta ricciae]CAF1128959.1 unnamed protein product [Adineta ricciae]